MTDGAEAWREEQRAVYSGGDPELLARQQQPAADALVDAASIQTGQRVLDIGAGTGNVALAAAHRGGRVTAIDLTSRQVEIGERRSRDAGLDITWHVAEAERLPLDDASVDVALSGFGLIYAAEPELAAAEVLRVLAPGGRALFTAHPPESFNGRALELVDTFLPGASEGRHVDEYDWARVDVLARRFPGRSVTIDRHTLLRDPVGSVEDWWATMQAIPIVQRLRESLDAGRFDEIGSRLRELFLEHAHVEADGSVVGHTDFVIVRVT